MAELPEYKLGCGEYVIMVQRTTPACGVQFYCQLKEVSKFSFGRRLNEVSEANVTVDLKGGGGNCCRCLSTIDPWEYEIGIYRDGKLVWVGPIIDIEFDMENEEASIYCRDLFTWTDHRLVELANTDYEPEGVDLADAFIWLLNHAYCKDPWCMTWGIDTIGIPVERFYPAFDKNGGERWGGRYPNVGNELRELSKAGVDFTVVKRHLWGGSIEVSNPASTNVILRENAFRAVPTVKVAGSKMVNRHVSAGGQGGYSGYVDDQVYVMPPTIGPITPALLDESQARYGLLEGFYTTNMYDEVDTTILPNAIAQDAHSRHELLSRPYVYISSATLSQDAPVTFEDHLIPGSVFTIALEGLTCRDLTVDQMRLTKVDVSVGDTEEVRITVSPIGTQSTYA